MTPEERELLEKTVDLAEKNNDLLKKMHRSVILGRVTKIIYYVVIILIALGAYYIIQPYVDALINSYNSFKEGINGVKNVSDTVNSIPTDLGSIIDSIKDGVQ